MAQTSRGRSPNRAAPTDLKELVAAAAETAEAISTLPPDTTDVNLAVRLPGPLTDSDALRRALMRDIGDMTTLEVEAEAIILTLALGMLSQAARNPRWTDDPDEEEGLRVLERAKPWLLRRLRVLRAELRRRKGAMGHGARRSDA